MARGLLSAASITADGGRDPMSRPESGGGQA
jgi:hypothetical protein